MKEVFKLLPNNASKILHIKTNKWYFCRKLEEMFLKLLLISVVFIGLAVVGFAIKMFFVKNGEFKKQCSSVDPHTGKRLGCSCEGAPGDGSCRNDDDKSSHDHKKSAVVMQFKEIEVS